MKKVLLIRSNGVNPDPPVEKVADTLYLEGYDVTVIGWDRDSNVKMVESQLKLVHGCIKVVRFGIPAVFDGGIKKNLKAMILFQFELQKWLKRNISQYDIIHAFDFDTGFIANKIAKKNDKKFIYHILDFYVDSHGLDKGLLHKIIKKQEFNVINNADCTILCTEKRKEQIEGSNPKKVIYIHNTPISVKPDYNMMEVNKNGRCKIAYVGILGQSRFLRQIISCVKKNKKLELHIGGFGAMEDEIINESKKCERINFYGKIPYSKTLELEQQCDIMTAIYDPEVPNHRYAAPNKFYEALMLGKPLIMAKNTGFDKIIKENDIGVLIDYDEEGLNSGLNQLIEKKSDWKDMGLRMRQLYDNEYSWSIMKNRICELYKEL